MEDGIKKKLLLKRLDDLVLQGFQKAVTENPVFRQFVIDAAVLEKAQTYSLILRDLLGEDIECTGYLLTDQEENETKIFDVFLSHGQEVTGGSAEQGNVMASIQEVEKKGMGIIGAWHSHGGFRAAPSTIDETTIVSLTAKKQIYYTLPFSEEIIPFIERDKNSLNLSLIYTPNPGNPLREKFTVHLSEDGNFKIEKIMIHAINLWYMMILNNRGEKTAYANYKVLIPTKREFNKVTSKEIPIRIDSFSPYINVSALNLAAEVMEKIKYRGEYVGSIRIAQQNFNKFRRKWEQHIIKSEGKPAAKKPVKLYLGETVEKEVDARIAQATSSIQKASESRIASAHESAKSEYQNKLDELLAQHSKEREAANQKISAAEQAVNNLEEELRQVRANTVPKTQADRDQAQYQQALGYLKSQYSAGIESEKQGRIRAESRISALEEQMRKAEEDKQRAIGEANNQIKSLQERVSAKEQERKGLYTQEDLDRVKAEAGQALNEVRNRAEAALRAERELHTRTEEDLSSLNNDYKKALAERESARQEAEEARTKATSLEQQLQEAKANSTPKDEVLSMTQDARKSGEEVAKAKYQKNLDDLTKRHQQKLEAASSQYRQEIEQATAVVNNLKEQLRQKEELIGKYNQTIDDLSKTSKKVIEDITETAKREMASREQKINMLEEELAAKNNAISDYLAAARRLEDVVKSTKPTPQPIPQTENADELFKRANFLKYENKSNWPEALKLYERVVSLAPSNGGAWYSIGMIQWESDRLKTLQTWENAAELKDEYTIEVVTNFSEYCKRPTAEMQAQLTKLKTIIQNDSRQ